MLTKFASAAMLLLVVEAKKYLSGEVRTWETFQYGKFKTRMQASTQKGTTSTFFLYWDGPNWTKEGWNEIGIEIVPTQPSPFSTNTFQAWGAQNQQYVNGFNPGNGWHEYEIEWTPEHIIWRINGNDVRRLDNTPDVQFINKPMTLMMSFWPPEFSSWGAGLNDNDMPFYTFYDYVEVYNYNQDTKGFDLRWRDDFYGYDTSRWHVSEGGSFDANACTWAQKQAYSDGSVLVIKMEKNYGSNSEPDYHGDEFLHAEAHHGVGYHGVDYQEDVHHSDVHHTDAFHPVQAHHGVTHHAGVHHDAYHGGAHLGGTHLGGAHHGYAHHG